MAARISESFIRKVRSAVNIVDVISQYVSLEKKGKDYVGLCPFHQEKTPSFTVSESKQFFKCFGCSKGGNVFKFLMYQESLTFPESVERIASMIHMTMPAGYEDSRKPLSPQKKMYQVATAFYHHILIATKMGEQALVYARKRALDDDLLVHFKIGYAPNQEAILLTYLRQQHFADTDLVQSGLFSQGKDGKLYDRFRDRLIFPLDDEAGDIVGFSGRRIANTDTVAKYMNSPETAIFTKSKLLFHLSEAKKSARTEKHLVLYEGYMDVIAAYKAGIKSGVASMGTSLTDDQVYLLRRVTPNVIVNYDGDDPGIHAAERATKMFNRAGGFNLGIVILPEKLDPDEYVKKYGIEKYQGEVRGALTATEFLLNQLAKNFNFSNDRDKLAYIAAAVGIIASLNDPVAGDLYLEKLAKQTGVTTNSLKISLMHERRKQRKVAQHKGIGQQAIDQETASQLTRSAQVMPYDPVLQRLLYLFMHSDEARDYLMDHQFLFPEKNYADIAELWLQFIQTHEMPDINSFLDFIPERLQGIIVSGEMAKMPEGFSKRELTDQLHSLVLRRIHLKLDELLKQLSDAMRKNDAREQLAITQKIIELKRIENKEAF